MHFFDQDDFIRNASGIPQHVNQHAYAQRFLSSHKKFFLVQAMRRKQQMQQQQTRMQQQLLQATHPTNSTRNNTDPNNNNNTTTRKPVAALALTPSYYALDSSPYYLLASDRIPDAILCVAPWARWLAILRHPVARAESHFRHLHQARYENNKPMVDWQSWIQDDIRLLTQAGVLLPRHVAYIWGNHTVTTTNDNTTTTGTSTSTSTSSTFASWEATLQAEFDAYSGSTQEMQAWKRYNRSPSSQQIVGRGLYAIQIGHYIAALQRFHTNSVANKKQQQPRRQDSHPGGNNATSSTNDNDDDTSSSNSTNNDDDDSFQPKVARYYLGRLECAHPRRLQPRLGILATTPACFNGHEQGTCCGHG
jgi:hypothetical protein